ncbi:MAG: hypothetical protein M0008_01800 [Actinomycetota bacterium]|jgi:hypothetical protein|nr:hypothetical protein [Actinomycetota bacterium]
MKKEPIRRLKERGVANLRVGNVAVVLSVLALAAIETGSQHWLGPQHTLPWIAGFTADGVFALDYIDFGGAGGCATSFPSAPGAGAHLPGSLLGQYGGFNMKCSGNWVVGDLWKAASGMTGNPFSLFGHGPLFEYAGLDVPELYDTSSAGTTPATTAEWVDLYWYGVKYKNTPISFTGEMTQQGACQVAGGCTENGTDAAPSAAWMSLWDGVDTLASNGHVSWGTADQMLMDTQFSEFGASTDVTWLQCAAGPPVCPIS